MDIRPVQPEAQQAAAPQPAQDQQQQQQAMETRVEAVERSTKASNEARRRAERGALAREPMARLSGSDLVSEVEKEQDAHVYRLVDRSTGEIVREFPPADLVEALSSLGVASTSMLDKAA